MSGEKAAAPRVQESLGTSAGIVPAPGVLGKPQLMALPGPAMGL